MSKPTDEIPFARVLVTSTADCLIGTRHRPNARRRCVRALTTKWLLP